MPSRYREQLRTDSGPAMVCTPAPTGGCLFLYPLSKWTQIENDLMALPSTPKNVDVQRLVLGQASDVQIDSKGRFLIPAHLREDAQLKEGEEVLLIGMSYKFEVWNAPLWNRNRVKIAENVDMTDFPIAL